MMSSFLIELKAVLCKVNKPICELPLKFRRELRKLKLDCSMVNSFIQCRLTIGKKHVFDVIIKHIFVS